MPPQRRQKKRKRNQHPLGKGSKYVLYFTISMTILGAIMIFDASVHQAYEVFHNRFYFLILHVMWILIGGGFALFLYYFDYHKLIQLIFPLFILNIILLIAVLIIGNIVNGSKRWFALGPVPIQPAEFIKPIFIVYISSWLAKYNKITNARNVYYKIFQFFIIIGIVLVLILLEPDLGTTLIIGATSLILFYISGKDKLHQKITYALVGLGGILASVAAILAPYRLKRLETYFYLFLHGKVLDPTGTGYQMQQILLGIGSGGWLGKGLGQSRQRLGYLVENTAFTDSIFAVFLEVFGFMGGIILIGSWLWFMFEGFKIASNSPDEEGKFIAIGITAWLTLQAFVNMGVNVGLLPLTGMPLPFLTYGGSNTVVTLIGIGILLNVSRFNKNR